MAKVVTPKELLEVWQQHCYLEFVKKDATAALGTPPTLLQWPRIEPVPK